MTTVQSNTDTIRILVVDDQNLIRETIQIYLEQEADLKVIGYAENGTEALEQIEKLDPDVVVLDLEMPGMDGLTTINNIRDLDRRTKILVLSSHDDRDRINSAIEAGAKGYLTKGTPAKELARAVRSVNQGYFQLGPGLMEKLIITIGQNEQRTSRSLEEKLVVALKRFKQDTNRQLASSIEEKLQENNDDIGYQLELKIHGFKKKHNELYAYVRKVEFKVYVLLLLQGVFLFGLALFWIINS